MKDLIEIKNRVEDYTGLKIDTKSQKRRNVFARACYAYIAERETSRDLEQIGDVIKRKYTTVMHYRKLADDLMREDYYIELIGSADPVMQKNLRRSADLAEHFTQAYLDKKKELDDLKETLSDLEPHEIEYRKLSEEAKEQFKIMAEAKLRMLRVKHEVK